MKNFENPQSEESVSEKLEAAKKGLTLSAAVLALTASMAEAQGQPGEDVLNCLQETTTQNIELVENRFPELNKEIAAFSEARDAAMGKADYDTVADISKGMEEVHGFRYKNFAYVVQMKDYCENELANLDVTIAQADAEGIDSTELAQKREKLELVVEKLEKLQEVYRDM